MWKSAQDTQELLSAISDKDRLIERYALHNLWTGVVFPADYVADQVLTQMLAWTEAGEDVIKRIDSSSSHPADTALALFLRFWWHDLLVDWTRTDIDRLRNLLEHELLSGKTKLPHRFGRMLYDRFNDLDFLDRTDHLLADD